MKKTIVITDPDTGTTKTITVGTRGGSNTKNQDCIKLLAALKRLAR